MYFPKEDSWMDPDKNIRRLESIETDLIQHLEFIQDPTVVIKYQKELNKLLRVKMEWVKLKNKLELVNSGL